MSSRYRTICLNHAPPLIVETLDDGLTKPEMPIRPVEHPDCTLACGRYSYPIIEIWLPTPYMDRDGQHPGRWYDVSWIREFPNVARAIIDEQL